MRYDALIVGAGMSGLAAAVRLAHFGLRVAVLERHYLWGGLNSFYKRRGRRHDSGLHALTNWRPPGARGKPLTRILRQLRIRHEELRLGEQQESWIDLGGRRLRFTNEVEVLTEDVARLYPASVDRFRALCEEIGASGYDPVAADDRSARAVLTERLGDPALAVMLLLPVCWYGSARPHDADWGLCRILFQSLFLEGLCRPEGGVKTLLDVLLRRLRETGAELRTKSGVARIVTERTSAGDVARGVVLDDGTELEADLVLSCAGAVETLRLAGLEPEAQEVGQLSFFETICVSDRTPMELGFPATTVFFQEGERLTYERPDELIDARSGVVSIPNNFAAPTAPLTEGCSRVTLLANHAGWTGLDEETYAAAKHASAEAALDRLAALGLDPRPHEVDRDTFTPRTIEHYTGRVNGAVYGSPRKRHDGETGVDGLVVCGTDQGFLGVVGALLSGVAMANRHALSPTA